MRDFSATLIDTGRGGLVNPCARRIRAACGTCRATSSHWNLGFPISRNGPSGAHAASMGGKTMPKHTTYKLVAAGASALLLAAAAASTAGNAGDDTLILGAAVSLTGKYSVNGKNTKDGYDIAVKRINEMGGVKVGGKSYTLKVVYYDDESTPARGAQLAERLISQDGVKFLLGPYSSGLTKAIAPVTEKYKVPQVEANGAARELFTQGYRYLFAVLNTSDYYLRDSVNLAAEVAREHGRDPKTVKIAMAFENDPFSLDMRDGVLKDAKPHATQVSA